MHGNRPRSDLPTLPEASFSLLVCLVPCRVYKPIPGESVSPGLRPVHGLCERLRCLCAPRIKQGMSNQPLETLNRSAGFSVQVPHANGLGGKKGPKYLLGPSGWVGPNNPLSKPPSAFWTALRLFDMGKYMCYRVAEKLFSRCSHALQICQRGCHTSETSRSDFSDQEHSAMAPRSPKSQPCGLRLKKL